MAAKEHRLRNGNSSDVRPQKLRRDCETQRAGDPFLPVSALFGDG